MLVVAVQAEAVRSNHRGAIWNLHPDTPKRQIELMLRKTRNQLNLYAHWFARNLKLTMLQAPTRHTARKLEQHRAEILKVRFVVTTGVHPGTRFKAKQSMPDYTVNTS